MSKLKVRTVPRSDINEKTRLILVRDEWLPIPKSIIPLGRKEFLWTTLQLQSYDSSHDYPGELIDNLQSIILRSREELSRELWRLLKPLSDPHVPTESLR